MPSSLVAAKPAVAGLLLTVKVTASASVGVADTGNWRVSPKKTSLAQIAFSTGGVPEAAVVTTLVMAEYGLLDVAL